MRKAARRVQRTANDHSGSSSDEEFAANAGVAATDTAKGNQAGMGFEEESIEANTARGRGELGQHRGGEAAVEEPKQVPSAAGHINTDRAPAARPPAVFDGKVRKAA